MRIVLVLLALTAVRSLLRLSSRARVAVMAFETEPTFRALNVGAGIVRLHHEREDAAEEEDGIFVAKAQFAAFGPKRFPNRAAAATVTPPEAHQPLKVPLSGAVAVVTRGKCSIETKMRVAAAGGASGVILINSEDSRFVAAPDPASSKTTAAGVTLQGRSAAGATNEIPLAVVSSSDGERITSYLRAADDAAGARVSLSVTPLSSDASMVDALRLPLFPVAQTLLPGQLLHVRVSRAERVALQMRFQLALQGPSDGESLPDDLGVATVAVVLVGDASSNLLASVGTLAHVDLHTLRSEGTHVTLCGVTPCHMRCLVRESTPKSFGLALVEPYSPLAHEYTAADGSAMTRDEVSAELRETIRRVGRMAQSYGGVFYTEGGSADELARMWDELPEDLGLLSFKACSILGLSAKREQAALQCRLPERVRVLRLLLRQLEAQYAVLSTVDGDREGASGWGGPSFVAAAVARAAPALVIVEPEGEGGERAAGFALHPDGLVVTNRHVANTSSAARVIFEDGGVEQARVVAESREYDIAFLRVGRTGLQTVALGDSDRCALGDWAVALGHPAEFDRLATFGIVSTILRPTPTGPGISPHAMLDRRATFIATDALYNKGISGGPLLNERGEVIGMNTFLRPDLHGLGFAIAVGRIREAALELLGLEL
mmetsp:Transcript_72128/g.197467  ORF Transcript_72128/g.197467 Transcript_72128/m.197467 type:complete len:661 (+) Transcript_72128:66-2048(+)